MNTPRPDLALSADPSLVPERCRTSKARARGHRGRAFSDSDLPRLKIYAREQVFVARLRGQLIPGPCEVAGDDCLGRICGHHRNGYANALDVVWLCARHHGREHAQMRRDQKAAVA